MNTDPLADARRAINLAARSLIFGGTAMTVAGMLCLYYLEVKIADWQRTCG